MAYLTIMEQFDKLRSEELAPVQADTAMSIMTVRTPESIYTEKTGREVGHSKNSLVLSYLSAGIKIIISTFDIIIVNMNANDQRKFSSISRAISNIEALFEVTDKSPQTTTIRALMNAFPEKLKIERTGSWCNISMDVPLSENIIKLTVYKTNTDVIVCNNDRVLEAKPFDTFDSNGIIAYIKHCLARYQDTANKTDIYGEQSDIPIALENTHRKVNLQKNEDLVDINDIRNIISSLANIDNENCTGTFSDGWKEALSTVANRLTTVTRTKERTNDKQN